MTNRTTLVTVGITALLLASGCETAADQRRKAEEAQTEANAKADDARREAEVRVQSAQAKANEEIAGAQETFSKMREDFRHELESRLVKLDKDVAELKAKAQKETGAKKAHIEANLPIIEKRRGELVEAFQSLQQASAATWDRTKGEVEKHWDELKHAVEAAD